MACGDKYANLVRTAKGLTPKRRIQSLLATEDDYASWHEAAHELYPRVNKHWSALRKAELEREEGTELSDALRDSISAYIKATNELPIPWDIWASGAHMFNPAPRIDQAIAVMTMGACELEKIDEAMAELGMDAPKVAGPRPTNDAPKGISGIMESVKTVAILAALGLAGYGIAKLVILHRKQAALPAIGE